MNDRNLNFKIHPFNIVFDLKIFLAVAALPFLATAVKYLFTGVINIGFTAEAVLAVFFAVFAVLRLKSIEFLVSGDIISVQKGFFLKHKAKIPVSKLSAVTVKQAFWEIPFGSACVILNTEGKSFYNDNFRVRLYKRDAFRFLEHIYGTEMRPAVRFSAKTLLLSALLSSSAVSGLFIGVPFITRLGKLFGKAFSKAVLDGISSFSKKFNTYFPPLFNILILILLLAYGFAVLYTFVKALNFRLFAGKEYIEVRSGLFIRQITVFKTSAVTDITVEQTFLMYLVKRYMLSVGVASFDRKGDKKSILIPCAAYHRLNGAAFLNLPYFKQSGVILRPLRSKSSFLRFIKVPLLLFAIISFAVLTAAAAVPYFERFILFLGLPFLFAAVYLSFYFYYNYRYGKISISDTVYVRAAHRTSFKEMYIPFENIGIIKLSRGIFARKKGSCNAKVSVNSKRANRIKVWHINYRSLKSGIFVQIGNNAENCGNNNQ